MCPDSNTVENGTSAARGVLPVRGSEGGCVLLEFKRFPAAGHLMKTRSKRGDDGPGPGAETGRDFRELLLTNLRT
jgi:hypothetical protein